MSYEHLNISEMLRLKTGAFGLSNAPVVLKTGAFDEFYMLKLGQMLRLLVKNRSIWSQVLRFYLTTGAFAIMKPGSTIVHSSATLHFTLPSSILNQLAAAIKT